MVVGSVSGWAAAAASLFLGRGAGFIADAFDLDIDDDGFIGIDAEFIAVGFAKSCGRPRRAWGER